MILLALLLLSGSANSADSLAYPTRGYRLWSWTAVEGLPSRLAESQLRAQEQLAAEISPSRNLDLYGVGAIGISPEGGGPDTGELYRLQAVYRRPGLVLEAGRIARWDVRGRHHLDGANLALGSGALRTEAWAGQLWHPETWSVGHTLVGGSELSWAPRPGVRTLGGAELRYEDGDMGVRLHGGASAWGARGERALAVVEGQPGEGLRATADGVLPVGTSLELELAGRWEGLEPASLPAVLDSPQAWLGADGYAVATAGARVRRGLAYGRASAGPTVHPGAVDALGGSGTLELGLRTDAGLEAGVSVLGVGLGDAWVAGAVLGGGLRRELLQVRADAGLFRYMPLSGGLAEVAEGRLRAEVPLIDSGTVRLTRRLVVVGEIAAGADRVLSRWLRGGVALHGTLAGPRVAVEDS